MVYSIEAIEKTIQRCARYDIFLQIPNRQTWEVIDREYLEEKMFVGFDFKWDSFAHDKFERTANSLEEQYFLTPQDHESYLFRQEAGEFVIDLKKGTVISPTVPEQIRKFASMLQKEKPVEIDVKFASCLYEFKGLNYILVNELLEMQPSGDINQVMFHLNKASVIESVGLEYLSNIYTRLAGFITDTRENRCCHIVNQQLLETYDKLVKQIGELRFRVDQKLF